MTIADFTFICTPYKKYLVLSFSNRYCFAVSCVRVTCCDNCKLIRFLAVVVMCTLKISTCWNNPNFPKWPIISAIDATIEFSIKNTTPSLAQTYPSKRKVGLALNSTLQRIVIENHSICVLYQHTGKGTFMMSFNVML